MLNTGYPSMRPTESCHHLIDLGDWTTACLITEYITKRLDYWIKEHFQTLNFINGKQICFK